MRNTLAKLYDSEPRRSLIYLGSLTIIRIVQQILLYRSGFVSVSADEFSRGLRAAKWSLQPRIDILADVRGTWLPLEKYLNGALLILWHDPIAAPRVTVFLGSCFLLVALYVLVYYLFDSFAVAALTALLVVFQPWYVWLAGTPMLEMYYLGFFFAGLFFLLAWLKEDRPGFWLLAGSSFLISSGFHVQSWLLINLVNLLTLGFLFRFITQRRYGRQRRLIAYYVLSNGLIILFAVVEFADTGQIFAFLAKHTSYSLWFHGGYDVPLVQKLTYYPQLLLENASFVIWFLFLVGLIFIWSDQARNWKLFPLALGASALALTSIMNALSGPPSAAPGRYSLFYLMMLAPYVAYGACRLFEWAGRRPAPLTRTAMMALALGLYIYAVWWGADRARDFPQGMPQDAVEVGRYLNWVLNESGSEKPGTYMVELRYWDFLAVELAAGHYGSVVYDREKDLRNRETPSIFAREPDDIYASLSSQNVRYVALQDPELTEKAQLSGFLLPKQDVGAWRVYAFQPTP